MGSARADIIEGLNVFRALEAWGATVYAHWAAGEADAELRSGHLIIAEREANHARLLAERIRALGAEPGPACVDDVLARQLEELSKVRGFVAQLDALKAGRSHAQIGQRPFEMGHRAPAVLIDLINGKKPADPLYTGLDECTPANLGKCPAK